MDTDPFRVLIGIRARTIGIAVSVSAWRRSESAAIRANQCDLWPQVAQHGLIGHLVRAATE